MLSLNTLGLPTQLRSGTHVVRKSSAVDESCAPGVKACCMASLRSVGDFSQSRCLRIRTLAGCWAANDSFACNTGMTIAAHEPTAVTLGT